MAYTMGLDLPFDYCTSDASTRWDLEHQLTLTHTRQYSQDLFGLRMARGAAIRGYVFLICLGSLVRI
jgi:hypothetical protein